MMGQRPVDEPFTSSECDRWHAWDGQVLLFLSCPLVHGRAIP